jgi:hypothetical protein
MTNNTLTAESNIDMRRYFERVIPFDGEHWIILGKIDLKEPIQENGRRPMWHWAVKTIDKAIEALDQSRATSDWELYVAMGNFSLSPELAMTQGWLKRRGVRLAKNTVLFKSLFLDIDVGEGKGYQTSTEARGALDDFLAKARLPRPSMIVNSGGGLHVYWTFHKAIPVSEWRPLAEALKDAIMKHGLPLDIGVIADAARVLRPPETFNTKDGGRRPVVILEQHADLSTDEMKFGLRDYISKTAEKSNVLPFKGLEQPSREQISKKFLNEETAGEGLDEGLEAYKPYSRSIDKVAEHCGHIKDALATGGTGYSEPLWSLDNLIAAFCEDPEPTAIRLSKGRGAYSEQETINKLGEKQKARREAKERGEKGIGFPSCSAIRTAGAKECATCPEFAKGKSPLNTGAYEAGGVVTPGVRGNEEFPGGTYVDNDTTLTWVNTRWQFVLEEGTLVPYIRANGIWIPSNIESMRIDMSNKFIRTIKDGETVTIKMYAWFMAHPKRPRPSRLVFTKNNTGPYEINLFGGYAIKPDSGVDKLSKVSDHIAKVLCGGDKAKFRMVIRWLAWKVQNPERRPESALVFYHPTEGAGKSTITDMMKMIFGKHQITFSKKSHFLGNMLTMN